MNRLTLTLATVLLLFTATLGQTNIAFRKAIRLENEGNVGEAILVYEDVLSKGRNTSVVYRLATAYKKVERYEDAIQLLEARLKRAPGDVTAINRLGDVYLASGKPDLADRQMERLLKISPNQGAFTSVGQRYERLNQDSRARDVYTRGRQILDNPDLFTRELAQIHERAEQYPLAVREYAALARQKPQFVSLVENKLKTIARNAEKTRPLFDVLLEGMKSAPRDSRATRILATFAIEASLTTIALREMLTLPPDAAIEGSLLRIGRGTLAQGNASDAILAYQALSSRVKNKSVAVQAQAGLARAYDLSNQTDEALQRYRSVLASRGNDHVKEETAYRLGNLLWRNGRTDSAITALTEMALRGNRSKWRAPALDLLGDIHLITGNDELAKEVFFKLASENKGKEEGALALYKMATLHVIRKEYATAQKALNSVLGGGLASAAFNDAIDLSYTLDIGQREDIAGLDAYSAGLRHEVSRTPDAAVSAYLEDAATGALLERRYKRGIEILLDGQEFDRAEQWALKLVQKETALTPWAHWIIGISQEHLDRMDEATATYEMLLIDFPGSLEADRARERLTDLQNVKGEGTAR